MKLVDKLILITGAAHGIGACIADECARAGAHLLLVDVDGDALRELCARLAEGGTRTHAFEVDVTDRDAITRMAREVEEQFGPLDVLINNAGVCFQGDFLACDAEHDRKTMDVNLAGAVWTMKAFMPAMVARDTGQVVNVASITGIVALGGISVYSATKQALIGLTEAVRSEMEIRGHRGVCLTAVCPGLVDTGLVTGMTMPWPLRAVSPERVAQAIRRAVERRQRVVRVPFPYRFLPQIWTLMPPPLRRVLRRWIGTRGVMDRVGQSGPGRRR